MRCEGERCTALTGKVGTATACGIYDYGRKFAAPACRAIRNA
jgi:hypothetical protein